jgi:RHS repeat-associated protein
VTWVFEEGTFVPAAKITEKQQYSIVTNYLGTPEAMYREDGEEIWACKLNSYGKVRNWQGKVKTDCPFQYQGQYEDAETGLYYNRFRYYSPEEGMYLSQDPTGLRGGYELYSYVHDTNSWIDAWGLAKTANQQQGDNGRDALAERLRNSSRYDVIATEVRINTPENGSYRKVDILVRDKKDKNEQLIAIEVKTGKATRDKMQKAKDAGLKKYDKTGPIKTVEVTVDRNGKILKKTCP